MICVRQRRTAPGGSSMAKLPRLSLATLTFLLFFYSTTLLTSYFYPLDWAPIRILTPEWIFNAGYAQLEKHQGKSGYSPPKARSVLGLFLGCVFTWNRCKSA